MCHAAHDQPLAPEMNRDVHVRGPLHFPVYRPLSSSPSEAAAIPNADSKHLCGGCAAGKFKRQTAAQMKVPRTARLNLLGVPADLQTQPNQSDGKVDRICRDQDPEIASQHTTIGHEVDSQLSVQYRRNSDGARRSPIVFHIDASPSEQIA